MRRGYKAGDPGNVDERSVLCCRPVMCDRVGGVSIVPIAGADGRAIL
jgi:hypothetical protein